MFTDPQRGILQEALDDLEEWYDGDAKERDSYEMLAGLRSHLKIALAIDPRATPYDNL